MNIVFLIRPKQRLSKQILNIGVIILINIIRLRWFLEADFEVLLEVS